MKKTRIAAFCAFLMGTAAVLSGCGAVQITQGTTTYVTNTYEITESFKNISISANTENISILPSEDGSCRAVCREEENAPHEVTVKGDTLTIEEKEESGKLVNIDLNVNIDTEGGMTITLYLPEEAYQALNIESNTGDVSVSDLTFSEIEIEEDTGNITLTNVIAADKLELETETGNVSFADCDSAEIRVETETGNITGNFLSGKDYSAESETGSVEVPEGSTGGSCELSSETGNIQIA